MARAYSTHRVVGEYIQNFNWGDKGRDHSEYLVVDERIILIYLPEIDWNVWTERTKQLWHEHEMVGQFSKYAAEAIFAWLIFKIFSRITERWQFEISLLFFIISNCDMAS